MKPTNRSQLSNLTSSTAGLCPENPWSNKSPKQEAATSIEDRLSNNFWMPDTDLDINELRADFARKFGLMPELAEFLGLRQFIREDTLNSVN